METRRSHDQKLKSFSFQNSMEKPTRCSAKMNEISLLGEIPHDYSGFDSLLTTGMKPHEALFSAQPI